MSANGRPWHWLKASMEAPDAFIMDPHGDLRLRITAGSSNGDEKDHDQETTSETEINTDDSIEEDHQFLVCSRTLARSSSVFDKMLFGPFAEGQCGSDRTIDLDDAIEPMFYVLSIMHCQWARVPRRPTFEELFDLLVFTNKYDMTGILRPWVNRWMPPFERIAGYSDMSKMAWVAWEIGAEKIFARAINKAVLQSRVNEEGEVLSADGELMKTNVHADLAGIIDLIARGRKDIISRVLEPLQHYARDILEMGACSVITGDPEEADKCDTTMMGSMVIGLSTAGIGAGPLVSGRDLVYLGNARELLNALGEMYNPTYGFHPCDPIGDARALAYNIVNVDLMPSPVTKNQRERLEKRARISGWTRED
ncbi:hypothetical protein K4K54_002429 [Colletotrichum sp. SAR 10_86]|nr:hypothetical protein K4K54_002429 [Colletotrichum sp. SAR 10_86]